LTENPLWQGQSYAKRNDVAKHAGASVEECGRQGGGASYEWREAKGDDRLSNA
jgi:hypothetical protein